MATMTQEQLQDLIRNTTIPLIKELVGKDVADLVRAQIESMVAAQKAPDYSSRLFVGQDTPPRKREPGTEFARCLRAVGAAKMAGAGPEKAIDILRSWGDTDLAEKWAAVRAKALGSGDPTAGGFLVPTQFSSDVIEVLRPAAVVRSLNPIVMPMSSGSLKIGKITSGATATYIGENANMGKTQEAFGQISMSWKKLAALVPISNDLIRYASPNADLLVRDDVVRALAAREDKAFIRDDGTSSTPKGLKYWIHADNKLAATGGTVSLANVTIDLGRCLQALMAVDIPISPAQNLPGTTSDVTATSRPGWIMSPRTFRYLTTVQTSTGAFAFRDEMLRGTLWGFPYRVTSQVLETLADTTGTGANRTELYFGAFAHAIIGEALGLTVDSSTEAAYYDGSTVVAAFSQDQTVIRVIAEHDFALRHDKSFALLQNILWGV